MAIMEKLILILVNSLLVMSCGRDRCACIKSAHLTGDISVNQFVLRDTSCFVNLGKIPGIIDDPDIGEFVGFSNISSSEFLLLVKENGGWRNQYNYFCLTDSINSEYRPKIAVLEDSVFYTTIGAHIGSSEMEFREKYKVLNFSVSQNASEKTYEFQDTINQYRSIYRFNEGILKYVEFGYVW